MLPSLRAGRCVRMRPIMRSTNKRDRSCRKSSGFNAPLSLLVGVIFLSNAKPLAAAPSNYEIAKSAAEPIAGVIATLLTPLIALFNCLDCSAWVLVLSTIVAAMMAVRGLREQRAITRTRETFAAVRKDLWDEDVLEARRQFSTIKQEVRSGKLNIARLGEDVAARSNQDDQDEIVNPTITQALAQSRPTSDEDLLSKRKRYVNNILNDLENTALGIRHNILDEEYLYRWMRTSLIEDWQILSPLVIAYRQATNCQTLYIEFEGLAAAWANELSYADKRRLEPPKRGVSVT